MLFLSLLFLLFPLLFSISVSALALSSPSPLPLPPSINICSTDDPSPILRNTHDFLRAEHRRDKKEQKEKKVGRRQAGLRAWLGKRIPGLGKRDTGLGKRDSRPDPGTPMVVDVYMHFVTSTDQARRYNPQIIETFTSRQATVLNRAFAPSNISFNRKPPTYTINDAWAQDGTSSTNMKASLRRGTYSTLNLYFQTNLSAPISSAQPSGPRVTLLGYCTLPTTVTYPNPSCPQGSSSCPPIPFPSSVYVNDGCNILASTLPGQTAQDFNLYGYNLGGTAVHETGHWFGLLHTFQDNTCKYGDSGDFIDDTNQERTSTQGCPKFKDSCGLAPGGGPTGEGDDPIHNWMDYSSDFCYTNFTPDQNSRMRSMFRMLRMGH